MLIATVCIADTWVSLVAVQSLAPELLSSNNTTYELHFRDLPTGNTAQVSIIGENDALCMFAAWITSDCGIDEMLKHRATLQQAMAGTKHFMP